MVDTVKKSRESTKRIAGTCSLAGKLMNEFQTENVKQQKKILQAVLPL